MKKDDEDEQDATGEGWYGKEIDRAQRGDVIREEGSPGLRPRAMRSPHEPGDGSLRDRNAQLAQLAADARRAPERVDAAELETEGSCARAIDTVEAGIPAPHTDGAGSRP
jgi:hypothetical protein